MKSSVRLLYFKGCPNVEEARRNLGQAMRQAGHGQDWAETDVQAEDCPPDWRGFPSPTILVDGRDVATGERSRGGAAACRFGGAPRVEQIVGALGTRPWLASLAAVPAAAIAMVPASFCPACVPALAGLLSAIGLGAHAERLLAPATLALLLVALGGLLFQSRRTAHWAPLVFGTLGAAAVYSGQFLIGSPALKWTGILVLIGASFWSNKAGFRKAGGKDCPACADNK